MSEALLAIGVPVGLMIATIAMQRLEHHLLGPAPDTEDDPLPRRAPAPSRPAS